MTAVDMHRAEAIVALASMQAVARDHALTRWYLPLCRPDRFSWRLVRSMHEVGVPAWVTPNVLPGPFDNVDKIDAIVWFPRWVEAVVNAWAETDGQHASLPRIEHVLRRLNADPVARQLALSSPRSIARLLEAAPC